jgi:hypothetical protein
MFNRWWLLAIVTAFSLLSTAVVYFTVNEIVRAGPGSAPATSPDVPTIMSYQGRLTNPTTGEPVANSNYNMHFAIYNAPTGGTLLWQEPTSPAVLPVPVQGGIFTILLGSIVPLSPPVFASGNAYLQVQVDDEILQPRQRIASVAYAMVAQEAENASTIGGADLADLEDDFVDASGDTMTGTLVVPALSAQSGSGLTTVEISGANALVKIGASTTEGNLQVVDSAGIAVLDFDGNLANLRVGGSGNEGDLQLFNDSNELVIDLDAEEFAGNAGLRLFAQDGTQAFSVNASTGDVAQSLGGDGLVKAAIHIDREDSALTIDRWFNNVNGVSPTISGSAGAYTIDMGFDVSGRFAVCTIDPIIVDTRNANCAAGTNPDPGSEQVLVRVWDPDDGFTAAEFSLLIY